MNVTVGEEVGVLDVGVEDGVGVGIGVELGELVAVGVFTGIEI